MRFSRSFVILAMMLLCPALLLAGTVSGKISFTGTPAKSKIIDMSKEPNCAKAYTTPPVTESIVAGAVQRKGNVVARVVANVTSDTLTSFVREAVSHRVSLLCTDQWAGYKRLDGEYPHAVIDHARGQYVIRAGSGNLNNLDKWQFCLNAA